jgi:hypothetical protein
MIVKGWCIHQYNKYKVKNSKKLSVMPIILIKWYNYKIAITSWNKTNIHLKLIFCNVSSIVEWEDQILTNEVYWYWIYLFGTSILVLI